MTPQQMRTMALFAVIGLFFGLAVAVFAPWPAAMIAQAGAVPKVMAAIGITALFATVGGLLSAPQDNSEGN